MMVADGVRSLLQYKMNTEINYTESKRTKSRTKFRTELSGRTELRTKSLKEKKIPGL